MRKHVNQKHLDKISSIFLPPIGSQLINVNYPLILLQFSCMSGHTIRSTQFPTTLDAQCIVPMFTRFSGSGSSISTSRPKNHNSKISVVSTFPWRSSWFMYYICHWFAKNPNLILIICYFLSTAANVTSAKKYDAREFRMSPYVLVAFILRATTEIDLTLSCDIKVIETSLVDSGFPFYLMKGCRRVNQVRFSHIRSFNPAALPISGHQQCSTDCTKT